MTSTCAYYSAMTSTSSMTPTSSMTLQALQALPLRLHSGHASLLNVPSRQNACTFRGALSLLASAGSSFALLPGPRKYSSLTVAAAASAGSSFALLPGPRVYKGAVSSLSMLLPASMMLHNGWVSCLSSWKRSSRHPCCGTLLRECESLPGLDRAQAVGLPFLCPPKVWARILLSGDDWVLMVEEKLMADGQCGLVSCRLSLSQ